MERSSRTLIWVTEAKVDPQDSKPLPDHRLNYQLSLTGKHRPQ